VAAPQDLSTVAFLPGPITKAQAPFDQHYPAIKGVSFRDTLFRLCEGSGCWMLRRGLDDLRVPPGNRLERLRGDRAGQHSIRINDQWRICFRWHGGDAYEVEICGLPLGKRMMAKRLPPVNPGEILLQELLAPLGISQYRCAKDINVPPRRMNEIVHGTRAISADTALRLARYFVTSERSWLNLQAQYGLDVEYYRLADRIEREIEPRAV
jgi:addiction module HigA family antidote